MESKFKRLKTRGLSLTIRGVTANMFSFEKVEIGPKRSQGGLR